jgi:hypothetical protein
MQRLEPFTHTNLRSLSFTLRGIDYRLRNLIDALTFPNLRVLEAHGVPMLHKQILKLLARSNYALERLIFVGKMTDKQRADYLALIPSLDIQRRG